MINRDKAPHGPTRKLLVVVPITFLLSRLALADAVYLRFAAGLARAASTDRLGFTAEQRWLVGSISYPLSTILIGVPAVIIVLWPG